MVGRIRSKYYLLILDNAQVVLYLDALGLNTNY